jgi:hypothetical protein
MKMIIDIHSFIQILIDECDRIYNHRIVESDRNGFRCLIGCSGSSGAGSSQLNNPRMMNFDMDGNIFVTDRDNNRIQKFTLVSGSCGNEKMREREEEDFSL